MKFAARYFSAILIFGLPMVQAAECNRNIPGHYTDRFTDNGNGTVFDNLTGLTWTKCDIDLTWNNNIQQCEFSYDEQNRVVRNFLSWQDALKEVQNFNNNLQLGFATDWRLPNIKEIASLQDLGCVEISETSSIGNDKAIDVNVFPYAAAAYWSSTPARLKLGADVTTPKAWKYNFKIINLGVEATEITEKNAIRLVRGTSSK